MWSKVKLRESNPHTLYSPNFYMKKNLLIERYIIYSEMY